MDHHDDDFWFGDDHVHPLDDQDQFSFEEHHFDHPWDEVPASDEYQPDEYQAELDVPADPDVGFPPELHLPELPDPVDGPPWIDVTDLAGGPGEYRFEVADPGPAELAAYAGEPGADWAALRAAEDPATAALARFWSD